MQSETECNGITCQRMTVTTTSFSTHPQRSLDRTIGDVGLLDLRLLLQEGERVIDDPRLLDELLELRLVVLQLARHLGNRSRTTRDELTTMFKEKLTLTPLYLRRRGRCELLSRQCSELNTLIGLSKNPTVALKRGQAKSRYCLCKFIY